MGLYTKQIENYIGGVSQQAYSLRYPNQFNEQINCVSSVVNGLIKRPPAELINSKQLNFNNVFTHKYSRSSKDKDNYLINFIDNGTSTEIYAVDLLGNEILVIDTINALGNYVDATKKLRFISLEDTTFILNTDVIVEKGILESPQRPLKALIYVKQSDYGKEFKVNIAGTEISYTTPDGSESSHSLQTGTDYIAEQLSSGLNGAGVTTSIIGGNIIVVDLNTSADVVQTSDGLGGRGLFGIKETINNFVDLPNQAPNGFVVKVINTDDIESDDYYAKFETDGFGDGLGTWIECVAPNISIDIDKTTMPHKLVFNPVSNNFTLEYANWDNRDAGDDTTNSYPSFINSKINDIFTFQDRLGLLSETFVTMSETSNYFNFFRKSAIVLGDDDVIDIGSNSHDSYILHSAIPWSELLILFSRDKQFVLRSSGNSLSPQTVSINQAGSYESNSNVKPKGAGSNLLFSATNGDNSNVYEMFISNYENTDARNTTTHISNYIPKNIKVLEVLEVYNLAAMISEEDHKTIYVYQYLFNGSEKVQSSFHKWTFDVDHIFDFKFIDNDMFIICKIQDNLSVMKLEINDIQKDEGMGYKVHLDLRFNESKTIMTYDPVGDITTMILPLYYENPVFVTREINGYPSGYVLKPIDILGNVITFKGAVINEKFYGGNKYTQYLEHSTMTSVNPYTNSVDIGGTVKVISHTLTYSNSGYFEVCISKKPQSDRVFKFYSKTLNDYENDFEEFRVKSGVFKYSVKSTNTQGILSIKNDSHLPCNIQSSEYAYRFYKNTN